MISDKRIYLVPYEFGAHADAALQLALDLAHKNDGLICLLHVVDDETDKVNLSKKLKAKVKTLSQEDQKLITPKVVVGEIFDDIGKAGDLLDAYLIVMGTKGPKGFQKLFGSNALKIVGNSNIPFIITQKENRIHDINKIVMTLDLAKESIRVVRYVTHVAKDFGAEVMILAGDHKDPLFKSRINLNMKVALDYLKENGVKADVKLMERKDFEEQVLAYAIDNNTDLLAATYYTEGFFAMADSFMQHLITNDLHLPVLTIDGEDSSVATQYGFITV